MKCIVEGDEVIDFLEFLHHTDKLVEVVPSMSVPEDLVHTFMAYTQDVPETQVEEATEARQRTKSLYKQTHWSTSELGRLAQLVRTNTPIERIVEELDRSPSAIRGKALYDLGYRRKRHQWEQTIEKINTY